MNSCRRLSGAAAPCTRLALHVLVLTSRNYELSKARSRPRPPRRRGLAGPGARPRELRGARRLRARPARPGARASSCSACTNTNLRRTKPSTRRPRPAPPPPRARLADAGRGCSRSRRRRRRRAAGLCSSARPARRACAGDVPGNRAPLGRRRGGAGGRGGARGGGAARGAAARGLSVFRGFPPTRKRHSASSMPLSSAYCLMTSVMGVPAWTFINRTCGGPDLPSTDDGVRGRRRVREAPARHLAGLLVRRADRVRRHGPRDPRPFGPRSVTSTLLSAAQPGLPSIRWPASELSKIYRCCPSTRA